MGDIKKSGDDYLFEITSFLITSAKRCLGPEYMYGAGRLVQTLNLLSYLPEYVPSLKGNELLNRVRRFVESDQHWWHGEKLNAFIEEMSTNLLTEIKSRIAKKKV